MRNLVKWIPLLCLLASCYKDSKKPDDTCTLSVKEFEPDVASYHFKQGSHWIYKLKDSSKTDTLFYSYSVVSTNYLWNNGYNLHACDTFSRYMYEELYFKHKMFSGTNTDLFYCLNFNGVLLTKKKYFDDKVVPAYFLQDHSDTLKVITSNIYGITKLYRQSILSNYTVLGTAYPQVIIMYYYPSYAGFNRVWWCQGVGFVKLEHINPNTNQSEIWELQTNHAIL